jgi:nucleotide-binding universal stress UspA family protein
MSYAVLMVHFDATPQSAARLRVAVELSARFNAALIGIAGRPYLPPFLGYDSALDHGDAEQQEMAGILADIGTKFRASAARIRSVEWRGTIEDTNTLVARQARAADLVILGRRADQAGLHYALDPGITILRAGRPLLLVPDDVDALAARRVVVAWKDSRESRRAVQDALPFLRDASEVMMVEVCEYGMELQGQKSAEDVAGYLRRHKVTIGAMAYLHTERSVAGEILRFAKDEKADLIVAGGYGRSRLGEWMFGGVTRDLLADSPLCCLFSH